VAVADRVLELSFVQEEADPPDGVYLQSYDVTPETALQENGIVTSVGVPIVTVGAVTPPLDDVVYCVIPIYPPIYRDFIKS
jgi:hypothetical protein